MQPTSPPALKATPSPLTDFYLWIVARHDLLWREMAKLDTVADELRGLAHANGRDSEEWREYAEVCVQAMDVRGEWKRFPQQIVVAAHSRQYPDMLPPDTAWLWLWDRYCLSKNV